MPTEEQFIKLEEEERELTDEAILAMLLILSTLKSNLANELRTFYQKYGQDGIVTYSEARKWVGSNDHRRRLTALLVYINENFDELRVKLTPEFKRMLEEVIGKEIIFFDADSENIADKPLTESWGADDKTWLERLEDDIAIWCAYILMDIKQSFLKRTHIDDVLLKLDKRFATMESVLTTLGLSESTAVGSMSRRMIFQQLGIGKYQFYTKADERTCEVCGSMHGLIFPISAYEIGVTTSPLHPRCRCWEVPIVD
jgi:SPP1 gp7 family putative phage head morphogenesis protein